MRADQLAVVEMMGEVYAKDRRIADLEAQVAQLEAKSDDFDAEMTIIAKAVDAAFGDGRLAPKDKANAQLADIAESKKWMTEQVDDMRERIAELEAALKRVCDEYQKTLDDMEAGGICASADVTKEFGGDNHPTLDRVLAQARREGIDMAINHLEKSDCPIPIDRLPPGQTKRQFSNTVIEFLILELRQMAREVKP